MRRLFFAMFSLASAVASQSACSVESENEWVGPPEEPRKLYDTGPITDPSDERCWVNLVESRERCGNDGCGAGSYCYSSVGTCKPGCRTVKNCQVGQICDFANPPPGERDGVGTCATPPTPCAGLRSFGAGPGVEDVCGDVRGVYNFELDRSVSNTQCKAYRARCAIAQSGCEVSFDCQTTNSLLRAGSFTLGADDEGKYAYPSELGGACHFSFVYNEQQRRAAEITCNPPDSTLFCGIVGASLPGAQLATLARRPAGARKRSVPARGVCRALSAVAVPGDGRLGPLEGVGRAFAQVFERALVAFGAGQRREVDAAERDLFG